MMNRASTTNGHPAASALAQGGYDAYFAQVEQSTDETESAPAATEPAGAPNQAGATPPSSVAPPPSGGAVAPQDKAPSAPDPGRSSPPAAPDTGGSTAEPGRSMPPVASGPPAEPGRSSGPQTPPQSVAGPPNSRPQVDTPTSSTGQGMAYQNPAAAPRPADPGAQWQQGPAAGATGYAASDGRAYTETHSRPQQAAPQYYSPQQGHTSDPAHTLERVGRPAYDNRSAVLPPALASAELLADIAAVRQAHLRSASGVRGALNKVGFSFGLSPAEQRAENRRNRVRRPLTAPYQIAVVSVKGGVGRTTTTAALGSTFAKMRPDRVAAVDANPDFGDLSTRTVRHPYGLSLRDLAASAKTLDSFSSVHAYTAVNSADLAVIASPWNSDATDALSGPEYATAVDTLRKHYNLLLVDCGTGVLDSATDMVLRSSDAVLVVTPATVGGVTGAVATLNWLSSHGFDHLIATSLVAIVHHQPMKPTVDVEAIEKLFASAQRPTCRIPFDPHLAEGGEVDLRLLERETALAFEELAAGLADDFPGYEVGPAGAGGRL